MHIVICQALLQDRDTLNQLLYQSKQSWGYTDKQMRLFMQQCSIQDKHLLKEPFFIAEINNQPVGFYGFKSKGYKGNLELEYLFIHPSLINKGIGKLLWIHAAKTAKRLNHRTFIIESDFHAESFYLKMGCHKIAEKPSLTTLGKFLPIFLFKIY